jgi:hypothetical protein
LREYQFDCRANEVSCEADVSPNQPEIATFGPAPIPTARRFFVSTYDYRRPQAPIATVSAQVRFIDWKVRPYYAKTFLRYSPDGHSLFEYDTQGGLHVFELGGGRPDEARTIDLGLSGERPYFQPVDIQWAPDNRRVAVILSFRVFHQGVVRVYDVTTGALQWERSFNLVEMGGEAWSPDGRRLAVTLLSGAPNTAYPERDIPNLLVLHADSGGTTLAIRTGDRAGPVCFAPGSEVLTAPLHSHDRLDREKVKVWDATTGRLVRQIASPGRDIHDRLELSQDGRVLLGYVGKERIGFVLRYLEVVGQILDRKFELFDYKTGSVIATSPNLTRDGFCGNPTELWRLDPAVPFFRLSAHGDRVLVYWPNRPCSPSVFEVSRAP